MNFNAPWKAKAKEMFPEFFEDLQKTDGPWELWLSLKEDFYHAYDRSPRDESLIRRIYKYADWCDRQPADDWNLDGAVAYCFYEHIPEHPKAREDMPRWWSTEDLAVESHERHIMQNWLTSTEFEELQNYIAQESHLFDPSLRDYTCE